jgi:hypothetical protein
MSHLTGRLTNRRLPGSSQSGPTAHEQTQASPKGRAADRYIQKSLRADR